MSLSKGLKEKSQEHLNNYVKKVKRKQEPAGPVKFPNGQATTARTYNETCRRFINKVTYCLEIKKLPKVYRNMNHT